MMMLKDNTRSRKFHTDGGIVYAWKNCVRLLLSINTITGLVDPQM